MIKTDPTTQGDKPRTTAKWQSKVVQLLVLASWRAVLLSILLLENAYIAVHEQWYQLSIICANGLYVALNCVCQNWTMCVSHFSKIAHPYHSVYWAIEALHQGVALLVKTAYTPRESLPWLYDKSRAMGTVHIACEKNTVTGFTRPWYLFIDAVVYNEHLKIQNLTTSKCSILSFSPHPQMSNLMRMFVARLVYGWW